MAKNSKDVAVYREMARLQKRCKELVPEIYACFCKVLIEKYNWDAEQVEDLFLKTQDTWEEAVSTGKITNMIDVCEQSTGIRLSNR